MRNIIYFFVAFVSLFWMVNPLTCISNDPQDNGHVKCSRTDYCVYFSGKSSGSTVKFQGCSSKWYAETNENICTGDEYDQGTVDGEDYTVQCCEENNCNTGKNGNGVETYSVFGSTFLLIFINVFMVFKNH